MFSQPDLKKIKISSSHCTALFVLTQNSYSVIEGDHNYFSQCCKNASIVEAEQNIKFSHHQISVLFLDAFQFKSLPSRSHDFKTFNIYDWHFSQTEFELTCERKVFGTFAIFCIFARLIQIGTGFVTILVIHLADPQDQDSPWMNTRTGSSVGDRSMSVIFSSS